MLEYSFDQSGKWESLNSLWSPSHPHIPRWQLHSFTYSKVDSSLSLTLPSCLCLLIYFLASFLSFLGFILFYSATPSPFFEKRYHTGWLQTWHPPTLATQSLWLQGASHNTHCGSLGWEKWHWGLSLTFVSCQMFNNSGNRLPALGLNFHNDVFLVVIPGQI